ncbi:MAG: class I SAM-dependent methyltransferase [Gammaproteobacteria bacterium]
MTNKTITLTDELYEYLKSVSLREPPILQRLRWETSRYPMANMQIAPEQGQFMALLIMLMGATRALEVGVFTGYSALWTALALPPEGKLVACDIDESYTNVAQRYWQEAGVADRIELRLAPAIETMNWLINMGEEQTYDFIFIDADKQSYLAYYEGALRLLRAGGLIAVDNVLWSGKVADPAANDPETLALRQLNEVLHRDSRVNISLLPIADGLTLAVKR